MKEIEYIQLSKIKMTRHFLGLHKFAVSKDKKRLGSKL